VDLIALIAFTVLAFTGSLATRMLTPALSFFLREGLRASFLGVSTLTAGYMLGRSLTAYFSGGIGRRWKHLPSICLVLNGSLVLLYPLAEEWYEVTGLSFLQGALMGLTWPFIQYLVMEAAGGGRTGRAISIYFFVGSIAGPAGDAIYGALFSASPVMSVVLVSLSLYLLSSLLAYLGSRGVRVEWSEGREEDAGGDVRWLMMLGLGMGGMASVVGSSIIYVILREWFSLSRGTVALLLSMVGGLSVGSKLLSGYALDRMGAGATLRALTAMLAMGSLLIGVRSFPLFLAGLSIISTAVGAFIPASRAIAYTFPNPASAVGKLNSLGNIGTVAGLLAIGAGMDALPSSGLISPLIVFLGPFTLLVIISTLRLQVIAETA